jgi:hypothetical protein
VLALFGAALTLCLASAGEPMVTVTGKTDCPTAAEVTARLGDLLSRRADGGGADIAELRADDVAIRLTLRTAQGKAMGQRTLPRTFSCAELADAIGVVLKTWETDIHPELELELDAGDAQRVERVKAIGRARPSARVPSRPEPQSVMAPPPPVPLAPVASDTGSTLAPSTPPSGLPMRSSPTRAPAPLAAVPAPARESAPAAPEIEIDRREPVVVARAAPRLTAERAPATIELLAGAVGGLAQPSAGSPTTIAIGARAGVGYTWARTGGPDRADAWRRVRPDAWGAELGLLSTTERSTALPSGTAEWRRDVVAIGPHLRWTVGPAWLTLELHAEALGALLHIRGAGFSSNGESRSFGPGFGAGGRLLFGRARVQTWIDLRFADWIVSDVVYEQPGGHSGVLPRREGMLTLGVSWSVRP